MTKCKNQTNHFDTYINTTTIKFAILYHSIRKLIKKSIISLNNNSRHGKSKCISYKIKLLPHQWQSFLSFVSYHLIYFFNFEIFWKRKKINFFCINNSSESNHMKYEMTLIFSKFIYHNGNNISKKIINKRKNCHIRYLKIYFIYLVLNFYFIISNID